MSEINDTKELHEGGFPINLKLIDQYQRKEPGLMAKYNMGMYQTGYFRGGSNINPSLITCEDNNDIPSIIQSLVLHWYHIYILRLVTDRTETMICQHFY